MNIEGRRRFLKFLAGSPLLASVPAEAWQEAAVLENPKDALNVMEFEAAARKVLPPAHYGFMATGLDDDCTLKANQMPTAVSQRPSVRPGRVRWGWPLGRGPTDRDRAACRVGNH